MNTTLLFVLSLFITQQNKKIIISTIFLIIEYKKKGFTCDFFFVGIKMFSKNKFLKFFLKTQFISCFVIQEII